jgi:hypothetical protein
MYQLHLINDYFLQILPEQESKMKSTLKLIFLGKSMPQFYQINAGKPICF